VFTRPTYRGDESELIDFVWSANFHRRHLTESQRAMAASKREAYTLGMNKYTEGPPAGGPSGPTKISAMEAAKSARVSPRAVERGRKVMREAVPEVVLAVEAGELSINAADVIASFDPERQRELLAEHRRLGGTDRRSRGEPAPAGVPSARRAPGQ
jgi:hypothetical protein